MFQNVIRRSNSNIRRPHQKVFLNLNHIDVKFKKVHALKNISLQINKGEFIFITGQSGAGKTSLLKLISGDIKNFKGEICGQVFSQKSFISEVFQDIRLISNLTCMENLELAYDPSIYKSTKDFKTDLKQLSSIFEYTHLLNHKIKDCNGGVKQLVSMTRALLTKPNLLLADEPSSALDTALASKLFDVLNFYNSKRGVTVIWASHNRELIQKFNGKIIHLQNGRIAHTGNACFI